MNGHGHEHSARREACLIEMDDDWPCGCRGKELAQQYDSYCGAQGQTDASADVWTVQSDLSRPIHVLQLLPDLFIVWILRDTYNIVQCSCYIMFCSVTVLIQIISGPSVMSV